MWKGMNVGSCRKNGFKFTHNMTEKQNYIGRGEFPLVINIFDWIGNAN